MPRKSNGSKRSVLKLGLAKHRICGSNEVTLENDVGNQDNFSKVCKGTLRRLARFFPRILHKVCSKLFLIPFTQTAGGQYIMLEGKALSIHRLVVSVGLGILAQKSWATIKFLREEDLKIESFMCICVTLIYVATFCLVSAVIFKPKETVDLMNSWPLILDFLKTIKRQDVSPLDDVSIALKINIVSTTNQTGPLAAMAISLIFSTLPVCWYPTMNTLGLVPDGVFSTFTWQLIFAPFEYLTYWPAILVSSAAGNVFVMGLGVLKTYTKHMRAVSVKDMPSRKVVERMYVCMELHNRVLSVWHGFLVVPTIVGFVAFIIIALFLTIRYTQLPLYFYILCPYTAAVAMSLIFWVCYDTTLILRDAEDVLQKLQSHYSPYMRDMPKAKRTKVLKRAKAMRQLQIPIGSFGQFSLTLPVIIWEEILNQVLFLLSL